MVTYKTDLELVRLICGDQVTSALLQVQDCLDQMLWPKVRDKNAIRKLNDKFDLAVARTMVAMRVELGVSELPKSD